MTIQEPASKPRAPNMPHTGYSSIAGRRVVEQAHFTFEGERG